MKPDKVNVSGELLMYSIFSKPSKRMFFIIQGNIDSIVNLLLPVLRLTAVSNEQLSNSKQDKDRISFFTRIRFFKNKI